MYNGKFARTLAETTTSWPHVEQYAYLANVNHKLVNEINQSQAQKHYYKTQMNYQFKNHTDQLEEAFQVIGQRTKYIIELEEELERYKKDLRSAADDYISLKQQYQSDKEYFQTSMQNLKTSYEQKLKKAQKQLEQKYQTKLKRRVAQVQRQCEDRIKLYQSQIDQLTQNSRQLSHQLVMLQEEHRQMLLKNDTILQESIQRELRKRDFQAHNNHLKDLAFNQMVKKERDRLEEQLAQTSSRQSSLLTENKRLSSQLQVYKQRLSDLQTVYENYKKDNKIQLFNKYPNMCQSQTNTDKQYVPVAMPVDVNLASQVVSLRQFLIQKVVMRFLDFFEKAAVVHANKKGTKSLLTFKNCLEQLKLNSPQIPILLFLHTSLEKIIKIYCPQLGQYTRQFLTVKDEFIRKTLIECQGITNNQQRLYRLLELVFRLKNPINHLHGELTPGELKLVEIKLLGSLKKIFS